MTSRRPLTLHVSALSDAEYSSYTASLAELLSPVTPNMDWENVKLSVREARGWIRGRYGASVDGVVIDQILKRFSSDLGPQDILTGGQFFAVLRLVCHAQTGTPVEDSLVFVQANPEPAKQHKESTPQRSLSTKSAPPPPPRHPSEITPSTATLPTLPPRSAPPIPTPNPFTRSLSTPGPKRPRHDPQFTPDPEKPVSDSPLSSNPFRTQPPPSSPSKPTKATPSMSSASSASSSPSNPRQYAYTHATPPLPPRKPAPTARLPPPRHASLTNSSAQKSRGHITPESLMTSSKSYSISSPGLPPPPKPPKPPQATSPLIKQSLQAAKGAQSVKVFMEGLSKERRLEVIKKSGGGSSGQGGGSSSGSGEASVLGGGSGEGTSNRSVSPPQSFYDVAAARIGHTSSPSTYTTSSESLGEPDMVKASGPLHSHQITHSVTPNKLTPQFPFAHVVTPNTPTKTSPLSPSWSPSATTFPTFSPDASPTHGKFAPNTVSPTGSTRRSKSLHHPSPGSTLSTPASPSHSPPAPPPRRRRPESIQVTSGGAGSPFGDATNGDGKGRSYIARRSSASVASPTFFATGGQGSGGGSGNSNGHGGTGAGAGAGAGAVGSNAAAVGGLAESGMLDTLQRTFATLRPGAGFESARVRAEGRVWPSGYVKGLAKGRGGGEGEGGRLVDGEGDEEGDGGFGQDGSWDDDEKETGGGGGKGGVGGMERDELKMPVRPGEGWTTLA